MAKLRCITALLGAFSLISALPSHLQKRDIIDALPQNASALELRFQPVLDWDTDGCYQTAAISPSGELNAGRKLGGGLDGFCRDPPQLDRANTYSRARCNNGICGILYEYYYEKDQTMAGCSLGPACGHRHDFENIVVFVDVRDEMVLHVAASKHYGYDQGDGWFWLRDGTHPYMVYHKDGPSTHQHRFAEVEDMIWPENFVGRFFRAPLVGWNGWPSTELRDAVNNHDWGKASPKTADGRFADALRGAGSDEIGLDADIDDVEEEEAAIMGAGDLK